QREVAAFQFLDDLFQLIEARFERLHWLTAGFVFRHCLSVTQGRRGPAGQGIPGDCVLDLRLRAEYSDLDMRYLTFALLTLASCLPAASETKLLRYPDISRDSVVFVYAGDLWTAPRAGGSARRLTSAPGSEIFPKFSPDGQWIAFTGQYDG